MSETTKVPVLVTGGAGYIGSHAVLALRDAGWPVAVIDNLSTGFAFAVPEDVLKEKILPHIPVGRLGEQEEIARCVAFLASDDAGFITGSTLSANGGQVMV